MPPTVGLVVGRYVLVERLGAGGMGEVFRARDHDLQRDVAIKFLPDRFSSDPVRLARFSREARAASSLNHPNIVTIHEVGQASGLSFIVMEFVEGRTLRQILHDRPLPVKRVLDISVQMADGLANAHGAGIIHRDLKPENVMVTPDGFVKILDFGLAKLRADEASTSAPAGSDDADTQPSPHTIAGLVMGTAGYMSPEQARGEPADHRSDQFALGAVIYELATGQRAFEGASLVQTLTAIIDRDPEPIANLNDEFPGPARWAVERCLAKAPQDRYASTLDLAHELRIVRDHLSEAGRSSQAAPVASRRWRPRRWQVVAATAAAVLALLVVPTMMGGSIRWPWRPALPNELRVAVLPVSVVGEQDETCCGGLAEYVTWRLADLGRIKGGMAVLPTSEVRAAGVTSPSAARRALGATLAVSINVVRTGGSILVNVSLSDAARLRELTGDHRTFGVRAFSPDDVVNLIVALLGQQLADREKRAWDSATVPESAAGVLLAQGLAKSTFQQGQTKLEQYDQAQSLEQAIKFFNDAAAVSPNYAAAYAALGEARLRLYRLTRKPEDLELARQSVRRALDINDVLPGPWTTLGMILAQQGDTVEAEKAFGQAISRNPRGADTYREQGLAYQRARQNDKAESAYRKAIDLDPKSWSSRSYLGSFLYNTGRYPESEEAFRRGLELAPDNARLWSNLAGVYLAQERWSDAEKALASSIQAYSTGPALSNLGYLQYHVRRRYADAAQTFQRAAEISPRDPRIWKNLATARYWAGQRDPAMAAYRQAAALLDQLRAVDPTNPETLADLADCQAMLGDHASARALLAEARKNGPDGDALSVMVGAYETLGDREEALRQLRAALKAGARPSEFDEEPMFEKLRSDPRYAAIVKAAAAGQPAVSR
jgi:eukaryotic-like serine/threonine-protein kinase